MRKELPYVVALVALSLGFNYCYDKAIEDIGARNAEIARLEAERPSIDSLIDSLKQAYKRDTITLTRQVLKWRDSIVTKWDTVSNTVKVPVEVVREVVHEADSAITVCMQVVSTCEAEKAGYIAALANADSIVTFQEKQLRPSLVVQAKRNIVWVVVGGILWELVR